MRSLPKAILECSQTLAEGGVLAPKEFLHLGSRAAVDQAFCRLVKSGQLLRVARGTYCVPVREQENLRAPSTESVVKAMAEQGKQIVVLSGAHAARSLGLTRATHGPEEYLTTGRGKQLDIGGQNVVLKHAPYWMLSLGSTPAGNALRAIAWLGEAQADRASRALRKTLAKDQWGSLAAVRASLPSWMATAIGKASV
ncbi:hypothetical protein EFK68_03300 [Pseudomonas aeruginosa]|nr:hypothetical protein EFK68_03300 [Pseudomonas aeruginosa]